jgi:hypothetical protein
LAEVDTNEFLQDDNSLNDQEEKSKPAEWPRGEQQTCRSPWGSGLE